jgi:hypothetical protein
MRAREETIRLEAQALERGAFSKSGLFCQNPPSLAAAATATHRSRRLPTSGLFCQNPRSPAAAATAAHGSRRRDGAAGTSSASNALIAAFRRDSARRS